MTRLSVHIEAGSRRVTVDERSTVLQEKSWQVLSMLRARPMQVVGRAEIIDSVWQGNFLTGEKGLNQAVWAIRSAFADNPRNPQFIRTLPRAGYQWIYPDTSKVELAATMTFRRFAAVAASVTALAVMAALTAYQLTSATVTDTESALLVPGLVATNAYLVDRDIYVEFANGRRGILKNENNAQIGEPVLSRDGAEIAVAVHEDNACRMVTIKLTNGERQDFGTCPTSVT